MLSTYSRTNKLVSQRSPKEQVKGTVCECRAGFAGGYAGNHLAILDRIVNIASVVSPSSDDHRSPCGYPLDKKRRWTY